MHLTDCSQWWPPAIPSIPDHKHHSSQQEAKSISLPFGSGLAPDLLWLKESGGSCVGWRPSFNLQEWDHEHSCSLEMLPSLCTGVVWPSGGWVALEESWVSGPSQLPDMWARTLGPACCPSAGFHYMGWHGFYFLQSLSLEVQDQGY